MRGKVIDEKILRQFGGITPAYAGKSPTGIVNLGATGGSPPPMRGKAFYSF